MFPSSRPPKLTTGRRNSRKRLKAASSNRPVCNEGRAAAVSCPDRTNGDVQEGDEIASMANDLPFKSLPNLFGVEEGYLFDNVGGRQTVLGSPTLLNLDMNNLSSGGLDMSLNNAIDESLTGFQEAAPLDPMQDQSLHIPDIPRLDIEELPSYMDAQISPEAPTISHVQEDMNRRKWSGSWPSPPELLEDIFECQSNYRPVIPEDADDRDEESLIAKYLVFPSPDRIPKLYDTNAEQANCDMLIYAPQKYAEEFCIFQSSPELSGGETSEVTTVKKANVKGTPTTNSHGEGGLKKSKVPKSNFRKDSSCKSSIGCKKVSSRPVLQSDFNDDKVKYGGDDISRSNGKQYCEEMPQRNKPVIVSDTGKRKLVLHAHGQTTITALDSGRETVAPGTCTAKSGALGCKAGIDTIRRISKSKYYLDTSSSVGESNSKNPKNRGKTPVEFLPLVVSSLDERYGSLSRKATHLFTQTKVPNLTHDDLSTTSNFRTLVGPALIGSDLNTEVCNSSAVTTSVAITTSVLNMDTQVSSGGNSNHTQKMGKLMKSRSTSSPDRHAMTLGRKRKRNTLKNIKKSRSDRIQPTSRFRLLFQEEKVKLAGNSTLQHSPKAQVHKSFGGQPLRSRRRKPLPEKSVDILNRWLSENLPKPYPSREEKDELALQTGLKSSQIDNWMGNARQKLKLSKSRIKKDPSESSWSDQSTK